MALMVITASGSGVYAPLERRQACVAELTRYRSVQTCLGRSESLLRYHRSMFQTGGHHPQVTRRLSAMFLASSPPSNWSLTSHYVAIGLPHFEPRDV